MSPLMRRNTYDRPAAVSNTFSMLRIEMSGPTSGGAGTSRGAALGALEKKDIVTPKLTHERGARVSTGRLTSAHHAKNLVARPRGAAAIAIGHAHVDAAVGAERD